MPVAPKKAPEGSRYLSQIVGERAREARTVMRKVSQEDVAERMETLGHSWFRQTVAKVENAKRNLTVDELVSLAAALQTTVAFLVSPSSPLSPNNAQPLDVGGPEPLDGRQLRDLFGFNAMIWAGANGYYQWPDAAAGVGEWKELDERLKTFVWVDGGMMALEEPIAPIEFTRLDQEGKNEQ